MNDRAPLAEYEIRALVDRFIKLEEKTDESGYRQVYLSIVHPLVRHMKSTGLAIAHGASMEAHVTYLRTLLKDLVISALEMERGPQGDTRFERELEIDDDVGPSRSVPLAASPEPTLLENGGLVQGQAVPAGSSPPR